MGSRRAFTLKALLVLLSLPLSLLGEVYRVSDLAGGLRDNVPGEYLADNEASVLQNFHVDTHSRGLLQRRGSIKKNTTTLSGSGPVDLFPHVQSDGDAFLIAVASRTITYSTDNGVSHTTLLTTATAGAVWDGVSFSDDNFYMVNQNDGGRVFNGTSLPEVSAMPSGKYIEAYQNFLFVGNTASFPYRLFFSGLLQPTSFTTGTDFIDFPEAITCIGPPFDGGLPVYTKNTTWLLRGSNSNNFYLQQISNVIGCAENRSIQNMMIMDSELQVFFSYGQNAAKKNLYGLTGSKVIPLADNISTLLTGVQVYDSRLREEDWDLEDEFELGTTSNTSTSISPDSVVLSSWTAVDTSSTNFVAGTLSNVSTYTSVGSIYLSTNNVDLANNGFESGSGADADNWSGDGLITAPRNSFFPRTGSWSLVFPTGSGSVLKAYVTTLTSSTLASTSYSLTSSFAQYTLSMNSFRGRVVMIAFSSAAASNGVVFSDPFMASGDNITFWAKYIVAGSTGMSIDDVTGGKTTIATGTFVSQTFDTAISSPSWDESAITFSSNSHSVTFETQSSDDGVSFDSLVSLSPGAAPTSASKRYIRYKVSFSTTSSGTALPYVDDVTLSAKYTSGTFTSEMIDGGATSVDWTTFSVSTTGGGGYQFFYRTAASTTSLASTSWTVIVPGMDLGGSGRYYQWSSTITTGITSSDDPSIDRVTQAFGVSSGVEQPGDSVIWNDEYWLTYTTTGATNNNRILVMNDEGKFSIFSGLNVYGFGVITRGLYGGDSLTTNGGFIRQLDIGTDDDGTAITAVARLKDQGFPTLEDFEKLYSLSYFSYGVDVGTFTASAIENYSEEETDYTIPFSSGTTVRRWKLEIDQQTNARTFALQFTNSYLGSRLFLYPPVTYHFEKSRLIPQ